MKQKQQARKNQKTKQIYKKGKSYQDPSVSRLTTKRRYGKITYHKIIDEKVKYEVNINQGEEVVAINLVSSEDLRKEGGQTDHIIDYIQKFLLERAHQK